MLSPLIGTRHRNTPAGKAKRLPAISQQSAQLQSLKPDMTYSTDKFLSDRTIY
jgi:hypothetical protein